MEVFINITPLLHLFKVDFLTRFNFNLVLAFLEILDDFFKGLGIACDKSFEQMELKVKVFEISTQTGKMLSLLFFIVHCFYNRKIYLHSSSLLDCFKQLIFIEFIHFFIFIYKAKLEL